MIEVQNAARAKRERGLKGMVKVTRTKMLWKIKLKIWP